MTTACICGREESVMKTLTQSYRSLSVFMQLNVDRLIVPLLVVAALLLAGQLFSYATVH